MRYFFLDIRDDRDLAEVADKAGTNWLLIGIAGVALVALIGLFVWSKRRKQQPK